MKMLIYDVGMHNGDDTAYYLMKGAKVIAVEADPALCSSARERFASEIAQNSLKILNVAVSDQEGEVDFFINENSTVQSSLHGRERPGFKKIRVNAHRLSRLFKMHGMPSFVKIDVEHYDHIILRDLRTACCLPDHLSVEAHNFEVVRELLRCDFGKFRLLRGNTIARRFANHKINTPDGAKTHSFPQHSSGPFGDDLNEPWISAEAIVTSWLVRGSLYGQSWYDIHAMK